MNIGAVCCFRFDGEGARVKEIDLIKQELEAFVAIVRHKQFEMTADPSLIDEQVELKIETGFLSGSEIVDLKLFLDELEEEAICCPIEEHFGEYYDECGVVCRVHLVKEVEHDDLSDLLEYCDGVIRINVRFWINYIKYEGSYGSIEITQGTFDSILDDLVEMTEEEYALFEEF